MERRLEKAVRQIEDYLDELGDDVGLDKAVDTVIESNDAEALATLAELMRRRPEPDRLPRFWALAEDEGQSVDLRVEALNAVAGVLLNAQADIEDGPWEGEEALMTESELAGQVDRLLKLYREPSAAADVRRHALEVAANLSEADDVVSAGRAAHASDDPEWIATGLLVLSLTEPVQRRDLIYGSLEHTADPVRLCAIRGLATLGEEVDIEALHRLAREREGDDRVAALEALAEIPDPLAGEALDELTTELRGDGAREAEEAYNQWLAEWSEGEFDDDDDDDEDDEDDDFEEDDEPDDADLDAEEDDGEGGTR